VSTLRAEDIVVRDARGDPTVTFGDSQGTGFFLISQDATLSRVHVDGMQYGGVSILGSAVLTDVLVTNMRPNILTGRQGFGIDLLRSPGTSGILERVRIERALDDGIVVGDGGSLVARELAIVDTLGTESEGRYGRAIEALLGARVTVDGALFVGTRDVGVSAADPGTEVDLANVAIIDTQERRCATTSCPDSPAGMGLGAYAGGTMRVRNFLVEGSHLCGVHVAEAGSVDLRDGEVRGNPIGACVQVDGYDVTRLQQNVAYSNNGVSLDATTLPVPRAGPHRW
jgi:hypothetical protein